MTTNRRGPIYSLYTTLESRFAGYWMLAERLPFRKPAIPSKIDSLTATALKNHSGIARGRAVIFVGRADDVLTPDQGFTAAAAIRTVASDDLRLGVWHSDHYRKIVTATAWGGPEARPVSGSAQRRGVVMDGGAATAATNPPAANGTRNSTARETDVVTGRRRQARRRARARGLVRSRA